MARILRDGNAEVGKLVMTIIAIVPLVFHKGVTPKLLDKLSSHLNIVYELVYVIFFM